MTWRGNSIEDQIPGYLMGESISTPLNIQAKGLEIETSFVLMQLINLVTNMLSHLLSFSLISYGESSFLYAVLNKFWLIFL